MSSSPSFSPCAVIPVYNHGSTTRAVVDAVIEKGLPVVLVDDGSIEETRIILEQIAEEVPQCSLFRLNENQGKGGAVIKGLLEAENLGYTHALQVDSDGQHDLSNLPKFLKLAKEYPQYIIAGYPVYDETVPTARKIGRKLTTGMVYAETLSKDIVDAMCGFRFYPLKDACSLIKKHSLGKRMDFDIEFLVKLHWQGVPMKFLPVRVVYPEGGISHFRMFHDNALISAMHTKLFIGMIFRFPVIIARNIKIKKIIKADSSHWTEQKEKGGSTFGMKLLFRLFSLLGGRAFRVILYPVVFFFFLFSPGTRKISRSYLNRVREMKNESGPVKNSDVYRHIFSFSYSLLEKFSAWAGKTHSDQLEQDSQGVTELKGQLQQKKGAVIICSHLGNMEMLRAFASLEAGEGLPSFGIHSIVDFSGTAKFNKALKEINPESMVHLVNASDMGVNTIIELKEAIDSGDLVIIAGDRTAKNNKMKTTPVNFLGEEALFPQGAFVMTTLLDSPVYFMFGVRSDDRDFSSPYEFHVYKSEYQHGSSRTGRKTIVRNLTEEYVGYLEKLCLEHPYQWYNFYDFWKKDF
ncbi:MAG: glycosyltransferase [Spirochaetales bacterium]|nr:glycosyltransferase [Spirochaetales bacterium]